MQSKSLFINGVWLNGSGGEFVSTNPATGEELWSGNEASAGDVQKAIDAARASFPEWSALSSEKRTKFLNSFKALLVENRERLATTISKEMGKPYWEADMEVGGMINKIPISIHAFNDRCFIEQSEVGGAVSKTRFRPHGVVAVFGPFNFPGHLPNGHIVPALLAGNAVVYKPSEQVPLTAQTIIELWQKAGLPEGVLNLVQGAATTGRALSENDGIDGIFFTGSSATGTAIREANANKPQKILALEMGGNNPIVVSGISDAKAAAYHIIQSAYITSGQRCVCARRLIIDQSSVPNDLLDEVVNLIDRLVVGSKWVDDKEAFMGPVINDATAKKLLAEQAALIKAGAKVYREMQVVGSRDSFLSPGLLDVSDLKSRKDEEIFGPILQVIRVDSFDEAVDEAKNTKYGLSASLLCNDRKMFEDFVSRVKAGIMNWNRPTTGASSAAPFGGVGASGNYRPSAYFATDYCSYPCASMESSKLELPVHITPGIKS